MDDETIDPEYPSDNTADNQIQPDSEETPTNDGVSIGNFSKHCYHLSI